MVVSWLLHAPASVPQDDVALYAHRVGAWMRANAGLDSFKKGNV